jgi:hypothetical protein
MQCWQRLVECEDAEFLMLGFAGVQALLQQDFGNQWFVHWAYGITTGWCV